MPEEISFPDPSDHQDTPWTDQNGQRWLADSKGRWSIYVEPPEAGGGASAFADLTDKASADLPTINTPLANALALKAPIASPTFTGTVTIPSGASISGYLTTATAASTYAPISTTVTLGTSQTLTGAKTFENLKIKSGSFSGTIFDDTQTNLTAGRDYKIPDATGFLALTTDREGRVTPSTLTGLGTGVATALGVNTGSTGAVALQGGAISATTLTASGAVTFATDNTHDIGANGANRPRNVYAASTLRSADGVVVDNYINFRTRGYLYAISNGIWRAGNEAATTGARLDFTTLDTLRVRQLGSSSVDGAIMCGNLTASGIITGSNFKRGTGSPESVVTGSVGDIYTRTDGGAGTTLYVKESGTGNTGWIAK